MRRLLAYLGVAIALAGCGFGSLLRDDGSTPVDMTPADLVGVWHGSRGDALEFTADGMFFGDNLKYMFEGNDLGASLDLTQKTAPASGRWEIGSPLAKYHPKAAIALQVDVVANQPTAMGVDKLSALSTAAGVRLRYYIGDPDSANIVEYQRCDTDCTPVAPKRPSLGVSAAPAPAKLAGTWRDQHGQRLVLAADGTYAADDVRFAYVAAKVLAPADTDFGKPLPSTGTWSTTPAWFDPDGPASTVRVQFATVGGRPEAGWRALAIYQAGGQLVLATITSNPDVVEQLVYHREAH